MFDQKRFTINHSTWPRATAIALTLLLTMLIPNESLARQSTQAAPPGDAQANTFALPASLSPAAAGDEKWEDTFTVPGLGWGSVSALAADRNGNVYAGGYFSVAGGIPAQNVAKWDGLRWSALEDGLDWYSVTALVVDGNGVLYAGGLGAKATGEPGEHSYVARWNGATWSIIGDFTMWSWQGSPAIYALGVDGSNNVYVGGFFSQVVGLTTVVSHIARWDGTSWSNLGSGMDNGQVNDLWVDSVGNVFAGGNFTGAGGVDGTSGVAYWNRSNWESLGGGLGGGAFVRALAVDGTGNLFAASHNGILRWNGVAWSYVAMAAYGAYGSAYIYALAFDGNGRLHAGGKFTTIEGVSANGIARLDGATWSALGSGTRGYQVSALTFDGGGNLYAGGEFVMAGGIITINIARWSGSSWSALGSGGSGGVDGRVSALALDGSGNLYVGGSFTQVGGAGGAYGNYNTSANNIARWDGSHWFALGSGIPLGSDILDTVNAIAVSGSNVYVGGRFTTAGGVTVNNIARWDGQNWWPIGAGADGPVLALAVDGNGYVYAGGNFTTIGGVAVDGLARWNGTAWEKLPSNNPFCPNHYCSVSALTFDRSGNLYLGGYFEIDGSWRLSRAMGWVRLCSDW